MAIMIDIKKSIKKKSNGYTLVEVIIALAMIGILSVSFLSIFTSGFRSVIRTGQRAVAAYGSQQLLSQKVVDAEGLEADEYTEDTITFTFKGGPSIDIDVLMIETEVDINGNSATMNGFVNAP